MNIKKISRYVCLFGLLSSKLVWAQTWQTFEVKEIEVEGLQRSTLGAALIHLPIKVGDKVNQQDVQQAIKSLYASENFESIELTRQGSTLIVRVIERPTIAKIVFDGNDDISDDQLLESLHASGIKEGEALDRTKMAAIEKGLQDFYFSSGKYNAKVRAQAVELPRNRIELQLHFIEGEPSEIQQINFVGNDSFSDETLRAKLELKDDVSWWNFLSDQQYQKQKLEADLETIKTFYQDQGYVRYKAESTQVTITPDRENIYVTININEGKQYKIKDVRLSGNLLKKDEEIEKLVKIPVGEYYNSTKVTQAEARISRYLGNYGYAYPKVKTYPEINDKTSEVSLNIHVDPGLRIYVRHINFEGNIKTKDEVLRREMRQLEGAWLDKNKLDLSKQRLRRLGFFEQVDYTITRLPESPDKVDINFNVKEQPSGSINGSVGYSTQSGVNFGLGFSEQNFLGTGNSVGLNLSRNKSTKKATLSATDPYFTKDGVSLSGVVNWDEYDAGKDGRDRYKRENQYVGAGIGFPVNENNRFRLGAKVNYDKIDTEIRYDYQHKFAEIYALDDSSALEFLNYQFSLTWIYNTLNGYPFPTKGVKQTWSNSISTPNSDLQYFKSMYSSRFYFPIDDEHDWVFVIRDQFGYGNGYGTKNGQDQILPWWENYTAGSIRGFSSNGIGPRSLPCQSLLDAGTCSYDGYGSGTGGNALAVVSTELIFPTPFVSEGYKNNLRTSLFVDVGNVWNTEFDVNDYKNSSNVTDYSDYRRYRASAGISLEWLSPLGMLSFSYAEVLKKYDEDREESFSFNIGSRF